MNAFWIIVAIGFLAIGFFKGIEQSGEMESLARTEGVTDIRRGWFRTAIDGKWRGYRTSWRYIRPARGRMRAVVEIYVVSPSRLVIAPRNWWYFTPFDPPLLEQFEGPLAVRAEDALLAERLFHHPDLYPLLAALTGAYEKVEILTDAVRVQRRLGPTPHTTLLEAFRLAAAIVEELDLPSR